MQQGPIRQRLFRGPIVFFTDAVVLILPPWKTRIGQAAGYVAGGVLSGQDGLDLVERIVGGSTEARVESVNLLLQEVLYTKHDPTSIPYADLMSEFGDWAEMWPNSDVVRANMKMKGILGKRVSVTLKPRSGLTRGFDASPRLADPTRDMLKKAFGSRFSMQ
jgi:hypothetical protein